MTTEGCPVWGYDFVEAPLMNPGRPNISPEFCESSLAVRQQLPKLYQVGSTPISRSKATWRPAPSTEGQRSANPLWCRWSAQRVLPGSSGSIPD